MNRTIQTEQDLQNPWKKISKEELPSGMMLFFAGVLYFLASVIIPLSFVYLWSAYVGWTLLLLGGVLLMRHAHLSWTLTAIASVAAYVLSGFSPVYSSLTAALCVGLAAGSFLCTCTRRFYLPLALTLVACGVAFAVSTQWIMALAAAALLPATLLLSGATLSGEYRTTAICYAIGGFLLSGAALAILGIWQTQGSVSLTVLRELLAHAQKSLVEAQIALREEYVAAVQNMVAQNPTWNEEQLKTAEQLISNIRQTMSDEILQTSVSSLFGLLPAFGCILCMIPAFLGQDMLNAIYAGQKMQSVLTPENEFFTMSLPAAVLCIFSSLITVSFFGESNIAVTVIANLCLILLPGFTVLGVRSLRSRFLAVPRAKRSLFVLLAVFLLCCSTVGVLFMVPLFGACERILSAMRRRLMSKLKKQFGEGDPSSNPYASDDEHDQKDSKDDDDADR